MNRNIKIMFLILLIIIGKITGLSKELLLSYNYGASEITDSFFIANSIASLLYASLYMAVPAIIIPYYTKLSDKLNNSNCTTELYSMFQSFVLLSIILSVAAFIFSDVLINFSFPKISARTARDSSLFLKVVSLTFSFSTIVAFFNAIQVVNGNKLLSFVVPVVNNITFIVSILIFSCADDFIYVLFAGLFAWVLQSVLNAYYAKGIVLFSLTCSFPLLTKKSILVVFIPLLSSYYIEQANSYISIFFASGLGNGAVSHINYANKINLIVISIFIVFLNAYIFPKLASLGYNKEDNGVENFSSIIFCWIVILSFPIVRILYLHSNPIISLLFERGGFTSVDTKSVASVLSVLSLSLPLLLIRDLLNRVILSFQNSILAVFSLIISVGFNAIFSFYLSRFYGLNGVAIGVVVSTLINIILLVAFLNIYFDVKFLGRNFYIVIKCSFSIILSIIFSKILLNFLDAFWIFESLFFLTCYLLILITLGENDIRIILQLSPFIAKKLNR